MSGTTAIKLESVRKVYPMGEGQVHALRGLTLEIGSGEFVAVMGPSGSGKSTLLHLLGCLDVPTDGKVFLSDVPVGDLDDDGLARVRQQRVGFIFQTFHLIPTLTAVENVELPLLFQRVERRQRQIRARELLRKVGMSERMRHMPTQLSGGERQRVAIARALAADPQIILADEPTGNLDSEAGRSVLELLKQLNREGKTIILVTHNAEAAAYADRIIRLRDGQLLT